MARITEKLRPVYQRSIAEHEPNTVVSLRDLCRKVEAGLDAMKSNPDYKPKKNNSWTKESGFVPNKREFNRKSIIVTEINLLNLQMKRTTTNANHTLVLLVAINPLTNNALKVKALSVTDATVQVTRI